MGFSANAEAAQRGIRQANQDGRGHRHAGQRSVWPTGQLYTGSTEFTATDVSLRGNNALPVELRRRFVVQMRDGFHSQGSFADWELDLPHLSGVFESRSGSDAGWQVSTVTPNKRCSLSSQYAALPPEAPAIGMPALSFLAEEFWAGNSLHVPGGGDQDMLYLPASNTNRPTDGATYYWVTSGNWFFSCLTNGTNSEAFLARSA